MDWARKRWRRRCSMRALDSVQRQRTRRNRYSLALQVSGGERAARRSSVAADAGTKGSADDLLLDGEPGA
jgi:hypothetical protein